MPEVVGRRERAAELVDVGEPPGKWREGLDLPDEDVLVAPLPLEPSPGQDELLRPHDRPDKSKGMR